MTRLRRLILPVIAVAALSTAACSSQSSDNIAPSAGGDAAGLKADANSPLDSRAERLAAGAPVNGVDSLTFDTTLSSVRSPQDAYEQERALIQTGSVSLTSDDVAKAVFDLQRLLDKYDGLIDDERTETNKNGEVRMSRLVVRVPASDFDATMNGIAQLGNLTESTRKSKDVTTQVIDTRVRIRAQEESLARVEALLARAQSIRDIVAIEAQLTRRQADLDALKQTQAYLSDQTEMSTITVYLEKSKPGAVPKPAKKHHNAFVTGLNAGWDAFTDAGAGLAKIGGASLPFAGLLALLAWPLLWAGRRFAAWSRRTSGVASSEA